MPKNENALYNLIKDATKLTNKEVMSILKRYSDVDMFQMMFENEPNILWLIAKIDQNNMKQKTENDKFKQIDQKFDQIDKRFDSFETRFEEKFETLTKTLLGAIADVKKEMYIEFNKVNSRLDILEQDVAQLKTDVTQLKTDVTQLKTDVTQLKTDVAQLKTDVAQLKTDVAVLQSDVLILKSFHNIN
ncbi:Uncharacterized protein conserved in bacteria with the myosin-like domain [Mycoplasmopsis californica]|uniref:SPX domain-containing protein n=1 Tax=Mycoplasmopsis equigenitalium TaxID=114883 RepID=A0ABY5J4Y7_9BACT|nr:hypothetical protein [Mycoplasmopsis equigenitalium]UUD37192.1 hypothetical protein NPA09_01295 [Mycoplasmopsis equigenitalium]VEU69503.1 Uncharacterized protein conserved in bacteria with the myosin-like domain [Mycoplasmopsis californica]